MIKSFCVGPLWEAPPNRFRSAARENLSGDLSGLSAAHNLLFSRCCNRERAASGLHGLDSGSRSAGNHQLDGRFDLALVQNADAVQLLLGHTKVDSTVRYLGVELEDVLSISERLDI